MRIIHLADTHFGRQGLRMLNSDGLNQREIDLYDLSDVLAAQIIALMPDIIVIAGDLYNHKYPRPIAIQRAHRFLQMLRDAGLVVLVIGGNHDHKNSAQPSPLLLAEEFVGVKLFLEQGHFDHAGVRFHCLPYESIAHLSRVEGSELALWQYSDGADVLVAHAYAHGANVSSPPEEIVIPELTLHDTQMSGVLLGHVHEHVQLDPGGNAFYAGSLDRLTFKEADQIPSFWVHDIDLENRPMSGPAIMTSLSLRIGQDMEQGPRPFVGLQIDQDELGLEELDEMVRTRLKDLLQQSGHRGAVVMLRIDNAEASLRASGLRQQWLVYARSLGALWMELTIDTKTLREMMDADFDDLTDTTNGTMQVRYNNFLRDQDKSDLVPWAVKMYEQAAEKHKMELES